MSKRFLPILALLLVMSLGVVFFFKQTKKPARPESQANVNSTSTSSETPPTKKDTSTSSAAIADVFSEKDQTEIKKCFNFPAQNMKEFQHLVETKAKPDKPAASEWKNIHFSDGEGKKYRLRLEKETSTEGKESIRLKLFSVDQEGLPDPIKIPETHTYNPTEQVIQSYLEAKTITLEQEMNTFALADGEIRIETENGKPLSVELESKSIRASCSVKFHSSCRCFSAPNY